MEVKSRYEVIADLENKKRELIKERDSIDREVFNKEKDIIAMKCRLDDVDKQIEDFNLTKEIELDNLAREKERFDLDHKNKVADVERKNKDFDFKIKNTRISFERTIHVAEKELEYEKSQKENKIKTINEMINGVNESLERFAKLQEKLTKTKNEI